MSRGWLVALALALALTACIDFQEAENHYCATHQGCPDAGVPDEGELDAGQGDGGM